MKKSPFSIFTELDWTDPAQIIDTASSIVDALRIVQEKKEKAAGKPRNENVAVKKKSKDVKSIVE